MPGYSALIDDSLAKQLVATWNQLLHVLGNIPFYWYIVIIVCLAILIKLLIKS